MRSQFTIFNDPDACTKVENLQDWFHESCCNLRERPKSRENTPAALLEPSELSNSQLNDIQDGDDAVSEASSSGLPPPLISGDEYESFICGACVFGNPTLRRWAGSYGFMMVVRDTVSDSWRILKGDSTDSKNLIQVEDAYASASSGDKRPLSPSALEPDAKRTKSLSNTPLSQSKPCLAPPQDILARKIFDDFRLSGSSSSLGTGDIFCTFNFRERWCHCDSVSIVPCVIFS
jgi:E3 ubiquitin-protein ligase UBR7